MRVARSLFTPQTPTEMQQSQKLEFPKKFVLTALEQSSDDAGWAQLGTFGSYLTKLQPDFDSRLYGYKKLSDLVKAKTDLFVTEERQAPGLKSENLCIFVRNSFLTWPFLSNRGRFARGYRRAAWGNLAPRPPVMTKRQAAYRLPLPRIIVQVVKIPNMIW